jgi:hypothetical protein
MSDENHDVSADLHAKVKRLERDLKKNTDAQQRQRNLDVRAQEEAAEPEPLYVARGASGVLYSGPDAALAVHAARSRHWSTGEATSAAGPGTSWNSQQHGYAKVTPPTRSGGLPKKFWR